MGWVSPYTVALGVGVAALVVIVGRMRRESRSVIALNTIGVLIFLFGVRWAISLGDQAFGAMAAASLGAILFTMGSERSRVSRRVR